MAACACGGSACAAGWVDLHRRELYESVQDPEPGWPKSTACTLFKLQHPELTVRVMHSWWKIRFKLNFIKLKMCLKLRVNW